MKVLELFSGTKSVSKICEKMGYDVVSLDLKDADININILDWNYRAYEPGYFEVIWASPPCDTFSILRRSWIGRKLKAFGDEIITRELLDNDMETNGLAILNRTLEIIDYLKPKYYFIENPQTGYMKNYMDLPFYDVDYCQYGFKYKKPTRIWTNSTNFIPRRCNCKTHSAGIGHTRSINGYQTIHTLNDKYSIPSDLIRELFESI